jgi:hypothetical protein
MRVLVAEHTGEIIYVDGHMIAYWSRRSMHKGKITMLGRIMAGSQAVMAHDATGQAVFLAYHPPDIHLSRVILAYCEQVAQETGSDVFVIDRAVNSVALAQAFDQQELGLLCMLNDHEHAGLTSFEATQIDTLEDGTQVYSGPWKESRPEDPRCFVIVEPPEGKTLVYWGTPKVEAVLEKRAWPQAYRQRNEIQELIMTLRTLFLENLLRAFMAALLATLPTPVSLQRVLSLLFERRGALMEMPTHAVYWVNSAGLSLSSRRLLGEIIEGLGAMGLQDQRGKPIYVRLKEMPP